MKRYASLLCGAVLMASGVGGDGAPLSAEAEGPLQVRSVVRTHETGYDVVKPPRPEPPKGPNTDGRAAPPLKAKVVHIPKQEAADAQ